LRFWDSSGVVPLLLPQFSSDPALDLYWRDPVMVVWWGAQIECASAIARAERLGEQPPDECEIARGRLEVRQREWYEVSPTEAVRVRASRIVRVHPLTAADALQLAAAQVASRDRVADLAFVSFDKRLLAAAENEGFPAIGLP
jgi:predicted nucleic acid-binding protein